MWPCAHLVRDFQSWIPQNLYVQKCFSLLVGHFQFWIMLIIYYSRLTPYQHILLSAVIRILNLVSPAHIQYCLPPISN